MNEYILTINQKEYRAEVRKRPLSMSEFGSENAITMKARGFLQLSADMGKSPMLFMNVMTIWALVLLLAQHGLSAVGIIAGILLIVALVLITEACKAIRKIICVKEKIF